MRKILFILLIILLLVGAGLTISNGFELGNFQVWGVKSIIAENETIDNKNQELSDLVSSTYPSSLAKLNIESETLASTKKEYEDTAILVSNSKYYMQTEKYEIEFLWTKIGNYAQDNNVQIKIDVVNSSAEGLYDLKFIIAGEYIDVTQFIYDIENDSKLGFKIEDFSMIAVIEKDEETGKDKIVGVQGTFLCKEIGINIETIDKNEEASENVVEGEESLQKETTKENSNTSNMDKQVEENTSINEATEN